MSDLSNFYENEKKIDEIFVAKWIVDACKI